MTGHHYDDDRFTALAAGEPLLTREQEGELGFQIEAGELASERLNSGARLTESEVGALHLLVSEGTRARERFILANVRLARYWAMRRWRGGSVGTLSLDDLTSEGMRAVVHAVDLFDYTRGVKFSTYASYWVRQHQGLAVAKSLRLTFSENDMRRVREYLAWRDEFTATNFVAPTLDEVRAGMGLTARAAADVRTMANAGYTRSLDEPLGAGRQGLGDMIASPTPGPEAAAMANSEHARLADSLARLTARERAVVVARTGWDGWRPADRRAGRHRLRGEHRRGPPRHRCRNGQAAGEPDRHRGRQRQPGRQHGRLPGHRR